MVIKTNNDWENSDKAGLVSVGSHSLFISTNGPVRKAEAPVVIFITGGGAPTEMYSHLHSSLGKAVRNYFYDRAGYGRSERPPSDLMERPAQPPDCNPCVVRALPAFDVVECPIARTENHGKHKATIRAEDSASELHKLMEVIGVKPPYVLAAHSYGGIVARTYFALYPEQVAGIALLDTNSELLQQCLSPIPSKAYVEVTKDVDQIALLHLRGRFKMTDQEWEELFVAIARTEPASRDEATHRSGRELARHMQVDRGAMDDRPLLVVGSRMVRDWRLVLEEAIKLGFGTDDQVTKAKWWMESAELFWMQAQKVQVGLSSTAEWYMFDQEGHYFPATLPDETACLIKSLLDRVELSASQAMSR